MADKPILFSAPMVLALLEGRKTQERRIIKPQPPEGARYSGIHFSSYEPDCYFFNTPKGQHKSLQRIADGDRLYVREHWRTESRAYDDLSPSDMDADYPVIYEADNDWSLNKSVGRFRQGMHMPRWASRITLIVEDVKVERLQDISNDDAEAEGVECDIDGWRDYQMPCTQCCATSRDSYRTLWDSINGPGSWDANPWVAAYTFRVILQNIGFSE